MNSLAKLNTFSFVQKERDILSSKQSTLLAEIEELKNSLSSLKVEMKNEINKGNFDLGMSSYIGFLKVKKTVEDK